MKDLHHLLKAKILGKLSKTNGKEVRRFHAAQQWQDLKNAVDTFGSTHPYTCLVYRLNNVDPDDAYSSGRFKIFCLNLNKTFSDFYSSIL